MAEHPKGGPTEDTHGKSTIEQAGDLAVEALHNLTHSLKDSGHAAQQHTAEGARSAAPPAQRAAGDFDKTASGGATGRPGAYVAGLSLEGGVDPKSAGPFQEAKNTHRVSDAKSLGPYVVADVVDNPGTQPRAQPQSGGDGNNLAETATAAAEGVAATFGAVIPKANEGETVRSTPGTVKREEEPPQLGLRDPEGSYGAAKDKEQQTTNLTQATRDAASAVDDMAAKAGESASAAANQASTEAGKAGDWAREKSEEAGNKAGKAAGWVRSKTSEASDKLQGESSSFGRDAADTKERATGAAEDTAESAKGKASEGSSTAEDKLGRVKAVADESAERGGKRGAEGIEATQEGAKAAADTTKDYLESGKEKVRHAMSDPLGGSGAGTTSQGELHDAAVDAEKTGEERRQSVIDKAKELGSSITNSLGSLGRSAAGNVGDGANEEAGLTVQEREEAARGKERGHRILEQVEDTATVPYRYVAEIAERFNHSEGKHGNDVDDVGNDKVKHAADSTESAMQKLQESLHNAGEKIQEGITPTSREDALLSAGVIPSNTQDILTAKHED